MIEQQGCFLSERYGLVMDRHLLGAALLASFVMAKTFVMPQNAIGASPSVVTVTKAQADAFRAKSGVHDFGESTRGFLYPEFVLVNGVRDFGGGCTWGPSMPIMSQTKLQTMDYGSEQIAIDNNNCTALEERGYLQRIPAPLSSHRRTSLEHEQ